MLKPSKDLSITRNYYDRKVTVEFTNGRVISAIFKSINEYILKEQMLYIVQIQMLTKPTTFTFTTEILKSIKVDISKETLGKYNIVLPFLIKNLNEDLSIFDIKDFLKNDYIIL